MEGSMIDLSKYRFQSAKEDLETAQLLMKEGVFDKSISKLIDTAYRLREKADYQDFIIISKDQAMEQIEKALS